MLVINDYVFNQNAYLKKIDGKNVLIDPGYNYDQIKKELIDTKVDLVLITHYHFDHVFSLDKICNDYNIKAYIHKSGIELIHDPRLAKAFGFEEPVINEKNLISFTDKIDELPSLKITHAPGHSSDSCLYLAKDNLFVGDVIFDNGHGRLDLPDSSKKDMTETFKKLIQFEDNLNVYPGHGTSFILKDKKDKIKEYIKSLEN